MRKLFVILLLFAIFSAAAQISEKEQALSAARAEHRQALLTFTGLDWCIPCIRMGKEIFEKEDCKQYASEHLGQVQADFSRLKKHQLATELKRENEDLAATCNPKGLCPLTVLLDAQDHVVKASKGRAAASAGHFIQQIEATHHVS